MIDMDKSWEFRVLRSTDGTAPSQQKQCAGVRVWRNRGHKMFSHCLKEKQHPGLHEDIDGKRWAGSSND